jgi:hypothetical protein
MEECDSTQLQMLFSKMDHLQYWTGHTIEEEKVKDVTTVEI